MYNLILIYSKIDLIDSFHPDKCHVLSLGKFENINYTQRYRIYGKELEHVVDEKELGVTIDHDLTFEDDISLKVKKANMMEFLLFKL